MQVTIEKISANDAGGVVAVKWSMSASRDGVEIKDIGTSKFTPDPSASDFIPFDQLKESDVIGWVSRYINPMAVEERLSAQSNAGRPVRSTSLPWV
jgi:hypothetical protein